MDEKNAACTAETTECKKLSEQCRSRRSVSVKERLRESNVNVFAAVVSLTVTTLITVGIPTLAATLIVKAKKRANNSIGTTNKRHNT